MKKIAIIGGGISGLSTLHYLKKRYNDSAEITLYERNHKTGGAIASLDHEGFFFETGPNGFLTNQPNTLEFLNEIGFIDQLIYADESSKRRYIQIEGKLYLLPFDLINFLKTPLLTTSEKIRLIQGFFIKDVSKNLSIYDYTYLRFGPSVTKRLVDPFITGIYAGDIKRLHMQEAFPKMSSGNKHTKTKLCSFKNGMGSLIEHLTKKYQAHIQTGIEIKSLDQLKVDQIFCCTPAYVAADLLGLDILKEIPYAPVAVVGLSFNKKDFKNIPDGFGYLIPSTENKQVLGVLLESNVFKRSGADASKVFIRVMIGGRNHPEIIHETSKHAVDTAIKEIDSIYGLTGSPQHISVKLWAKAIAQYEMEYPTIKHELKIFLAQNLNLHLCANYLDGISFNDCIKNAKSIAAL